MIKEKARFTVENPNGLTLYSVFILHDTQADSFFYESDNPENPSDGPLPDNLEDAINAVQQEFPDAKRVE
jgi:hypothetical protein